MSNVRFVLNRPNDKNTTILLKYQIDKNNTFTLSTRLKVETKYWDKKNYRVKRTRDYKSYRQINISLNRIKEVVISSHRFLENSNIEVTKNNLKKQIATRLGWRKAEKIKTFWERYDTWLDSQKEFLSAESFRAYDFSRRKLLEFSKQKTKTIDFASLNKDLLTEFQKWCFEKKKYSWNSMVSLTNNMLVFFHHAVEEKWITKEQVANVRIAQKDSFSIYLSEQEIAAIENLDVSLLNMYQERARDIFLIGYYTAQRFSDYHLTADRSNYKSLIIDDKEIDIIEFPAQEKNENPAIVPVHPNLKAILEKYDYVPPSTQPRQLTLRIREVAEMAGITQEVNYFKNEAGKTVFKTAKKFELITTHTTRRSRATNLYKKGVPTLAIMRITGHKSESQLRKYIKVSNEESALIVAKLDFL